MDVMQKMFQYITGRDDTLILIWEKAQGWITASSKCRVLKDADYEHLSLFDLENWAHKDDRSTFHVFLSQLEAAIDGSPTGITKDEEKISVAVRLLSAEDQWAYQNINCWLERENGMIARIFVMTHPRCRDLHLRPQSCTDPEAGAGNYPCPSGDEIRCCAV